MSILRVSSALPFGSAHLKLMRPMRLKAFLFPVGTRLRIVYKSRSHVTTMADNRSPILATTGSGVPAGRTSRT
jgi:hypothetical protein